MKIVSFVDIRRTLLPCTGVGRHANGVLRCLDSRKDVDLSLLVGREQRGPDGRLPGNSPLRTLDAIALANDSRRLEQISKATGIAVFDGAIGGNVDWLYCPHDTLLRSRKAPVAITIHDARIFEPELEPRDVVQRIQRSIMRNWTMRAVNAANVVFTVSEFSKQRLVELAKLPAHKVVAVGNGLDDHILMQSSKEPGSKSKLVLTIGGLRHLKGGDVFVELASRFASLDPTVKFCSVGGPDDPDLLRKAELLHNFESKGFLSDEAWATLLHEASVLLFPSRYEGFGMPPIEAMKLGTAVVSSKAGSLPEVLSDGAVYADIDDLQDVIEKVQQILTDNSLRESTLEKAKKVSQSYAWELVADRVLETLTEGVRQSNE